MLILPTYVRTYVIYFESNHNGAAKAGSIYLLPHSINLVYDTGSGKKAFEVDHNYVDSLATVCGKQLWIKPQFLMPAKDNANKALCEPFWLVRKMDETEGKGSMTLLEILTSGSISSHPISMSPEQDNFEPSRGEIKLRIPVLTNPTDLKKGDELTWAFGSKKKRKLEPVKIAEKKAKTGGQ